MTTQTSIEPEKSSSTESDNVVISSDPEVPNLEPTDADLDKVYRHLDYRIIPALWSIYFMTSFGSASYGTTLTMNYEAKHSLTAALNLTGKDLPTASALYYIGYILFDIPMNLIMTKVSPQVWLSRITTGVGICYICYSALKNAAGLKALRFMTGFGVAGDFPGMAYYISLWYPEHRTARRIGYYSTAPQISAATAGLVSAGFQKMDMIRGYYGWQWLYLVHGSIMITVGLSLMWWLPNRPAHLVTESTRQILPDWIQKYVTPTQPLTQEERRIHEIDMRERFEHTSWGWKDVLHILEDPRTWCLILMYFGIIATGYGLGVFATTLIKVNNPHLSGINISLLYAPMWLFELASILIVTPFADKYKDKRPYIFCGTVLIIIAGLLVASFAPTSWGRWGGLLICGFGLGPTIPVIMTLCAEIMGKVHGDVGCAVAAAVVSGLGNLGSVVSVYALFSGWPADKARNYRNSNMILILMLGISIISCVVLIILRKHMSEDQSWDSNDQIGEATEASNNKVLEDTN